MENECHEKWRAYKGCLYHFIDKRGNGEGAAVVVACRDTRSEFDNQKYRYGNYYKTHDEARAVIDAEIRNVKKREKYLRELARRREKRRIAKLNSSQP